MLSGDWSLLGEESQQLMDGAFATGTMRNLRGQWLRYNTFCEYYNVLNRCPVTAHVLVRYIAWLCRSLRSQASVRNYVNGVKVLHLVHGLDLSGFSDASVRLALRGVDRKLRYTPRRAQPITTGVLVRMLDGLDPNCPVDATYRALFLLSFFLFLRKSNTVPDTVKAFDPTKQLVRGDCRRAGGVLFVHSKWSKTNQFGRRSHAVPLLPLQGTVLCPVAAFEKMCDLVPGVDTDPAFLVVAGGVKKPVTYAMFQRRLKASIRGIGLDSRLFSTHSFRRGGASLAFKAGISGDTIKVLGDWQSEAYQVYLECPLEVKAAASDLFRKAVLARISV